MKTFKQENKIYFSILSFLSYVSLTFCIIKNDFTDFKITILSFIFISVILFTIYHSIIKNQIRSYPINIFFNLYFLISFLVFLYNFDYISNFTYESMFSAIKKEDLYYITLEAIKLLLFTVIFLNLGFIIVEKILKKKNFNFLPNLSELDLIRLTFFLLIIKLLFISSNFFFSYKYKRVRGSNNPFNCIYKLLFIAI